MDTTTMHVSEPQKLLPKIMKVKWCALMQVTLIAASVTPKAPVLVLIWLVVVVVVVVFCVQPTPT